MSLIKSYSVGNGDMFYIEHNSQNFSIIDCCLTEENKDAILDEIHALCQKKEIVRFISTHPDEDHIRGLEYLDDKISIVNFYCVRNSATKEEETDSFKRYCQLRDSNKAFYINKGCSRKWMNESTPERGASGINVLWPDVENEAFKAALADVAAAGSPNNISAIVKYELNSGVTALWMGDLETGFMETIEDQLDLPNVDILFAPHHGRDTGRIPSSMLEKMEPKIIIIGEAPCEHLCYYEGYNTICQNSAEEILFDCVTDKVHIFTSNEHEVDYLDDEAQSRDGYFYLGTLNLNLVQS